MSLFDDLFSTYLYVKLILTYKRELLYTPLYGRYKNKIYISKTILPTIRIVGVILYKSKYFKSTASMGCFEIKGFSEKLWEPYAFQSFLESKISVQPKYDYENKDHKEIVNGLKVVANNNKRKELR